MKKNCWLIIGAMLSTSLLARQATNPTPPAPIETPAAAPAATLTPATTTTNAPAAQAGKKKAGKKKGQKTPPKKGMAKKKAPTPALKTVPLVPGPATVVATHVNVRGQPKLKSEIVTRVTKGDSVTVLEEIVRNNSGPDEPSAWAKIVLPPNAHVWVSSALIDSSNQTVKAKKLNVRSGPGENYSVIGRLQHGDAVKPVTTKGDWTEIEPPASAYAFMAAQYLSQEVPPAHHDPDSDSNSDADPDPDPDRADPDAGHCGDGPAGGAAADRGADRADPDAGHCGRDPAGRGSNRDASGDQRDSADTARAGGGRTAAAADRAA